MKLILASSSAPRKALLSRIVDEFKTAIPNIDETPKIDEDGISLVHRLSQQKAKAVATNQHEHEHVLIVSGDQIAYCNQQIFGKPKNFENAKKQLQFFSKQCVDFISGLCVYNTKNDHIQIEHVITTVEFKPLNLATIERYLQKDQPFECAGSFRSESLGMTLCKRISSDDPTAILGLPLIPLIDMLDKANFTCENSF